MVRASLFRELNGFDERYAPAYYEDVDLAFQVRQRGLRVLIQPRSCVFHHEGGTSGIDTSHGVKSYQVVNADKFYKKWATQLAQYGESSQNPNLAKDRWYVGRALVADVWPTPDMDAGSINTMNLLHSLLRFGYKVTFFPTNTLRHFGKYTEDLQRIGVECLYAPYVDSLREYLTSTGPQFNVVVLRRAPAAAQYLDDVRSLCPAAKVVFDTVDLHHLREERRASVEQSAELAAEAAATRAAELDAIRKCDCTILISEFELKRLKAELPDVNIRYVPFGQETRARSSSFARRADIAFIGGYLHQPNVDAVKYFLSEIWPRIEARLPDARFLMIGSNLPDEFRALESERIRAVGFVEELDRVFGEIRLSVAPLRFGAGIKGKVATSLSFGVPVVATPLAVEGMACEHERDLLVSDDPEQFAENVIRAYSDERLWYRLSDAGMNFARRAFSVETVFEKIREVFESLELPIRRESTSINAVDTQEYIDVGSDVQPTDIVHCTPTNDIRAIAMYLPQFHPIPENDRWWGTGFTEWTNVASARPLFASHYQPHLPADLGFYDLRLRETRESQAAMAKRHGVYGFCYYYYWFGGRRLLERPLQEVLSLGEPDYPFCVCWANENWSRRWDGRESEILMRQEYSAENDLAFIRDLIPLFQDPRYIRVNGRPLLIVYRTEQLPDARATADRWRQECHRSGIGDIYLCRTESFHVCDPSEIGFDAAYEFPPLCVEAAGVRREAVFSDADSASAERFTGKLHDYQDLVERMLRRPTPKYKRFRGAMVSWDNSARTGHRGHIWLNNSPAAFERWLRSCAQSTRLERVGDERLIFINAWNEWGEGCHLEPDRRFGRQYLEATRRALSQNAEKSAFEIDIAARGETTRS